MKPIIYILLLLLLLPSGGYAQDKVVESSVPKMPSWIGTAGPDFFTVSATAATMEEAQHKCMADIKQNIITAIAANITSSEQYRTAQISKNELTDVFEQYTSDVQTQGALLPFLTGISLTRATDVYWEKHYVKKEKRYYYVYYIQYPFTESERQRWTREFLEKDREQYDKYLTLKAQFDTFADIEFIDIAVGELETLAAYFFDNTRRNEVRTLQQNYRKLYGQIAVVPLSQELGEVLFCLTLGERPVTTARQARVKSESATEISVKPEKDKTYRLTYNYDGCVDDDENKIDLSYVFSGRSIKYTFYFDVKENKMAVMPQGVAEINCLYGQGDSLTAVSVNLVLRSKYANEFSVRSVTLHIPGIQEEVQSGDLNQSFTGKGTHLLRFTVPVQKLADSNSFLLDGTLTLQNGKTGLLTSISFKLPYKIHK